MPKEQEQEITFTFRVRGLNLQVSDEEDVPCKMRVCNVPNSPRQRIEVQLGPSKRQAIDGGNIPMKSRARTPESCYEEQETVEDEEFLEDGVENLVIQVTNPTASGTDTTAEHATQTGEEAEDVTPQGATAKEDAEERKRQEASGAVPKTRQSNPPIMARLGPPVEETETAEGSSAKLRKLCERIASSSKAPKKAQLAIEAPPRDEGNNPTPVQQTKVSIKDWVEQTVAQSEKDRKVKCLAKHCLHWMLKSQTRGHCLRYHLPDYFCREEEDEGRYNTVEKIGLRREALCKIMSALGAKNHQELLVAARILLRQTIPNATMALGDTKEINLFLKDNNSDPLKEKIKLVDAGLEGLMCWQVAITLINALTNEQKRQIMPTLMELGKEKRLRK